jgi:radical SAM protein with 4Fe4S-binding SPASM domain
MDLLRRKRASGLDPEIARSSAWVDEFIGRVRPYIHASLEDGLLIKRPNQAQRMNPTGAYIMKALLDGASIASILRAVGPEIERQKQVCLFLWEVRRWIDGELDELNASSAVQVEPLPLNFSLLPVLSEIALTYDCNLRCRFCYAGCNCTSNPTSDGAEMTEAQVRKVLTRIRREGEVPSVSFTGGEPTLRPELPRLIHYAKKRLGMRVNLITNGTLIDASMARRLAVAGLDSAQVSLEGVTAGVHEAITQVPGSFAASLAGVEALAAAGIRVHTNTTLNRINLHEADQMPAFVKNRLARERFSMNLVIPAGSAGKDSGLVIRYSEIGPVLERIQSKSEESGVEFMWYSPTPVCIFNPIPRGLGNKGCSACDGLLSVGANGDVLPCSSYDDPVGNILKQDLKTVWASDGAKRYRSKAEAPQKCKTCEHLHVCHGACPLYWRAMGSSELEVDYK